MKRGLGAAWPVALGYFPVAVAFGALGAQAGLSPLWVQLTSLLVFAGASQFALVGLLAQGVPPLLAALLGLLLNLRHAFYGPALRPYLRGGPLEAFFLTDEVFAVALRALPGLPQGKGGATSWAWASGPTSPGTWAPPSGSWGPRGSWPSRVWGRPFPSPFPPFSSSWPCPT